MPHHKRKLTGLRWNLIKHISMITMECLSVGSWMIGIKLTWTVDDRSADSETALLFDLQRREIALAARLRTRGNWEEQKYRDQYLRLAFHQIPPPLLSEFVTGRGSLNLGVGSLSRIFGFFG